MFNSEIVDIFVCGRVFVRIYNVCNLSFFLIKYRSLVPKNLPVLSAVNKCFPIYFFDSRVEFSTVICIDGWWWEISCRFIILSTCSSNAFNYRSLKAITLLFICAASESDGRSPTVGEQIFSLPLLPNLLWFPLEFLCCNRQENIFFFATRQENEALKVRSIFVVAESSYVFITDRWRVQQPGNRWYHFSLCVVNTTFISFLYFEIVSQFQPADLFDTRVADAQRLRLNWLHKYAKLVSDMCAPFASHTNSKRILRHAMCVYSLFIKYWVDIDIEPRRILFLHTRQHHSAHGTLIQPSEHIMSCT